MSHASVLVALSPADLAKTDGDVHKAVEFQMAPFDEGGQWFRDGSRWDWWQIGGRYGGRFAPPGYDPETDPANLEPCRLCAGTGRRDDKLGRMARAADPAYTCNGCGGNKQTTKPVSEWRDVGNTTTRAELTPEAIRDRQASAARAAWSRVDEERGRMSPKLFAAVYGEVPATEAEYVAQAAARPFRTYAFLRDRAWHEAGRMGWFGGSARSEAERAADPAEPGGAATAAPPAAPAAASRVVHENAAAGAKVVEWPAPDGSDPEAHWAAEFYARFVRDLPPDTLLVVVDYHV